MSGKIEFDDYAYDYVYKGLGFPIKLKKVGLLKFNDELHPYLDIKVIADRAIQSLCTQEKKLTGNKLTFMRTYLMMTTVEFAKLIKQPEAIIKKWEGSANKAVKIAVKDETFLKQQVQQQVLLNNKNQPAANLLSSQSMFTDKKRKRDPEQAQQKPPGKKPKPR
jgi:hypothetical protein